MSMSDHLVKHSVWQCQWSPNVDIMYGSVWSPYDGIVYVWSFYGNKVYSNVFGFHMTIVYGIVWSLSNSMLYGNVYGYLMTAYFMSMFGVLMAA